MILFCPKFLLTLKMLDTKNQSPKMRAFREDLLMRKEMMRNLLEVEEGAEVEEDLSLVVIVVEGAEVAKAEEQIWVKFCKIEKEKSSSRFQTEVEEDLEATLEGAEGAMMIEKIIEEEVATEDQKEDILEKAKEVIQ